MFCPVNEAFDNDTHKRIEKYENNRHKQINNMVSDAQQLHQQYDLEPPHTYEYDLNPNQGIISNYEFANAFFNAQGDYEDENYGTSIEKLKEKQMESEDNFTFSDFTLETEESKVNKKKGTKHTHSFYISYFLDKFLHDDMASLVSSHQKDDDEVFEHIKQCKYCRSKVNEEMKDYYQQEISKVDEQPPIVKERSFSPINFGYDIKEIVVIILVGICIIFILDLFVKIGRKTMSVA